MDRILCTFTANKALYLEGIQYDDPRYHKNGDGCGRREGEAVDPSAEKCKACRKADLEAELLTSQIRGGSANDCIVQDSARQSDTKYRE